MSMPKNKTELVVLTEPVLPFPTNKPHISYSEISDWMDCSYRHKLKHVDKIDLFDQSIHTVFGKVVHDSCEGFLETKDMVPGDEAVKMFKENMRELPEKDQEKVEEFAAELPDMIGQVPGWLDEQFPGWETVSAEEKLYEQIEKHEYLSFKGFIDAVIKVPKKRGKGLEYWILDWKTTGWGWKTEQKRSFQKQLQLVLYKHFFCQLKGVDLKDVKCGFVLIKRSRPSNGNRLELVPVSVGPKAVDKALVTMHSMINQVKSGRTMKNRRSCEPFCPYKCTKYCK